MQDKNNKPIYRGDEVLYKREDFKSSKWKVISSFRSMVWLYQKDHSTYHYELAYFGDIELIEKEKK